MEKKIKISFGIPTRNSAHTIGYALDSIISQATEDVEIVIVDGASTDNTEEVVEQYKQKFPSIQYFWRAECIGVDRDIMKCVELAKGEYCWLMSDDDCLEDRALTNVLCLLEENSNLSGATVNYTDYNKDMKFPVSTFPSSNRGVIKSNYLFRNADECFSNIGLHISFISAQIVKTRLWNNVVADYELEPYMNDWLMVYIIGRMIQREPNWLYIHRKCVRRRIGNDSFIEKVGLYNRQLIAQVAYRDTISGLFGRKSNVYNKIFYALLVDRMPRSLAVLKANGISFAFQLKLLTLYTRNYKQYILYWVKIVPLFFVPNFIFKAVRQLYFKWKSNTN